MDVSTEQPGYDNGDVDNDLDNLVDDDLDAEEDADDLADDLADLDAEPPAAPGRPSADEVGAGAPPASRPVDRTRTKAFARRVAAKALQIEAADEADRAALSALLGVTGDTADLTVAVMTGERTAIVTAGDVERIASADPFSAAVTAQETGRARMKAVASLLHALGETGSASLNGSDAKAAIAVAQGVHRMSETAKQRLARASSLARRTA